MNIIIFFIMLLVLVLVHEWGHFYSAKKFGIRVDEFGFGFPPKLFTLFKKGDTEYTFNLLPIGGFVKIFGENPDEENTTGPDASRSFVNKPKWQQAIVLSAGVFMNFVLAWVLFSVGFMSGLPTSVDAVPKNGKLENINLVVVSVLKDSSAEASGLKTGDKIVSAKNSTVELLKEEINPDSFKNLILDSKDTEVEVSYIRGKNMEVLTTELVPKIDENGNAFIGIAMDQIGIAKLSFFQSLYEGMKLNLSMTARTIEGFYSLISQSIMGKGSLDSVTGPVGMVKIVGDAYDFGFVYLLSFAALISINLAVINLLPFPALDGGRLLFLLIEKIKGSRINPKIANTVNSIGFILLILLMLVITYKDITKLL